jgi:hypothetical protein
MAQYLTLSNQNQFSFTCPVFNADTKMASCMVLREAVWMGKHVEKRRGCQAAMNCSMCPAAEIVRKISYGKDVSDDYGSLEPKRGKLHADILERIAPRIPIQRELERAGISDTERELLMSARPRVEAQLKVAPGYDGKKTQHIEPRKHASPAAIRPKPEPVNHTINQAAMTGDLSAAINAVAA